MKNPIEKIKNEQDFTLNEFAIACDVSRSSICSLIKGEKNSISDSVLDTLEVLGYDRSEIQEQYNNYRQQKRRELLSS